MLRGRAPGEMPRLIRARLLDHGVPASALSMAATELEAAHLALQWASAGDVVALPLHLKAARQAVLAELQSATNAPR